MDRENCVLDISSDEEEEDVVIKDQHAANLKLLCDQLFKDVDDFDDVVVVPGVLNPKQVKVEEKFMNCVVVASNVDQNKVLNKNANVDDDDDDCVILDGDPDKMVSVEESQNDGSDELVVVGEKGQVACRDYPHPRHLCVKYPFSSTLHTFHCELCHCYVCDTVAPCNLWGTGMSIVDHCHATDKLDVWKTERKNFKLKRCSSLPAIKMSENRSFAPSTVSTQISNQPHPLTRSITMPANHFHGRSTPSDPAICPVLSPAAFRPVPSASVVCPVPSAPNLHVPNIADPRSGAYRFPQSSSSQLAYGGSTKFINQRGRYQNGLAPQSVPFKRARTSVTYRTGYRHGYGKPQSAVLSYTPSPAPSQPISGDSFNRDYLSPQWINSGSNLSTGTVHNPLTQSHYVNIPNSTTAFQDVMPNQPATMTSQNFNQQATYTRDMATPLSDASVPWEGNNNIISMQWAQSLLAEFASCCDSSDDLADKMNSNSKQCDQLPSTEPPSTQNTSTAWIDNSNCDLSDQHLQPNACRFQDPQSMNAASNYQHNEHSEKGTTLAAGLDGQASAVPQFDSLRSEFEDWLMENQPAVGNSIELPLFSDQNILSPDNAHIDLFYDENGISWQT